MSVEHDSTVSQPVLFPFAPVQRSSSRPVWYSISDLSREFDVTLRALRFYEAKGLLKPIRQNASRVYGPRDRVRLQLILTGKRLGFTLTEIANMIADSEDSGGVDLRLNPDLILRQIAFLEDQHRTIETALTELRRHYYLMAEVQEPAANDKEMLPLS